MQRGLDWYKRDPILFLHEVQGMGPELIGAYGVMVDLIYSRAGKTERDDRHLSGIMGCSLRKARKLTDELISRKKIEFQDGFITHSRANQEAKSRRNLRETRSEQGRKGGLKSGESRKNNTLAEAIASSKPEAEKRREEKKTVDSSKTPQKNQKRGTRLTADWQLTENDIAFAREKGFNDHEIKGFADEFRDHWIGVSGQNGVKRDWEATWRNRIRTLKDRRQATRDSRTGSPHQRLFDGFERSAIKNEKR